jgi:hypothetical protein
MRGSGVGRKARAIESARGDEANQPPEATRPQSPAELAACAASLVALGGARHAAERLGLSVSHVRNLARLRRALAPEAWAAFSAEGASAPLHWWLALAALPAPDQLLRLRHRRTRPRRRSSRLLEQRRRELPPNDVRARVLGWVLGLEAFPHALTVRRLRETPRKPNPTERGRFSNGCHRLHKCQG